MGNNQSEVYGIGSALLDILVEVEDQTLACLKLKKGEMTLVDKGQCDIIEHELREHNSKKVPGGSTANTIALLAQLGAKTIFCGVVGNDINGGIYKQVMENGGVTINISTTDNITGQAITFITPDLQRTFAVHLGAALSLDRAHIDVDQIKKCKILHTEGYLIGEPGGLKDAALAAMDIAKKNGLLVSLDLSAPNIVRNNKEELKEIIKKYVDIVFANEDEAKELTGEDYEEALNQISELADIAIVKLGEHGSLIKTKGCVHSTKWSTQGQIANPLDSGSEANHAETRNVLCTDTKSKTIKIDPYKANAADTTGAGDAYAAGVLYGIINNIPLEKAGKLGSYLAAKVVSQIGARLEKLNTEEVNEVLKNE